MMVLAAYRSPATEKNVVGIDSPDGAATSRYAVSKRLFCRSVRPVLGGPNGRAARLCRCSTGLSTRSVPPSRLTAGYRVFTRTGAHIMPNEVKIDRATAAKINPLISSLWTEDTLSNVAAVVYEIGFMVSETELAKENTFRVFEVACAALWWELNNIRSAAQVKRERSNGN